MAAPFMDLESGEPNADMEAMQMPANVTCDAQGRFTMTLAKGPWLLSAVRDNYEMSPKNPPIRIPGMPEGMNLGLSGVLARASEAGPGPEYTLILRPTKGQEAAVEKPGSVVPQPLVLVGRACLSPGNVLHWTRTRERKASAGFVVKRSTTPFDGKAPVVEIQVGQALVGSMPDGEGTVFSLTDTTSTPGTAFYYAVQELGTKGAGPLSNVVKLTTR